MLAKLVDAAIDPARLDAAVDAVAEELVPAFLECDGAVYGCWAADTRSGRVLTMMLWADAASLRGAAPTEGAMRAAVGDRVGLRLHSVQTLPVLAGAPRTDLGRHQMEPGWLRVTWVDGLSPMLQEQVPERFGSTLADQSATPGFRGSYWLGGEHTSEGCAISLWGAAADLVAGEHASRRRRRRLSRAMGFHVTSVHEYRILGVARATSRRARPLQVVGA